MFLEFFSVLTPVYAQTLIVVAFLVVNFFVFLVIIKLGTPPCVLDQNWRKSSFKPPGASYTYQGPV